jgi:Trm5-related predicted tRNA methylase
MMGDPRMQYMRLMTEFLREKLRFADVAGEVIVRRHQLEELARMVGMDEEEAWRMFRRLKGYAWEGQYMGESHSEERGYTAARLTQVHLSPP